MCHASRSLAQQATLKLEGPLTWVASAAVEDDDGRERHKYPHPLDEPVDEVSDCMLTAFELMPAMPCKGGEPGSACGRRLTWLMLHLVEPAVCAGLEHTEHQEAAQAAAPDNDEDGGHNLPGVVVLGICQRAYGTGDESGAAQAVIQLLCPQCC